MKRKPEALHIPDTCHEVGNHGGPGMLPSQNSGSRSKQVLTVGPGCLKRHRGLMTYRYFPNIPKSKIRRGNRIRREVIYLKKMAEMKGSQLNIDKNC